MKIKFLALIFLVLFANSFATIELKVRIYSSIQLLGEIKVQETDNASDIKQKIQRHFNIREIPILLLIKSKDYAIGKTGEFITIDNSEIISDLIKKYNIQDGIISVAI